MSAQSTRPQPNGAAPKKKQPVAKAKAEAPNAPRIKILKQPAKSYRPGSARHAYWERFNQFNGKTLAELEQSCSKNPPSMPKKGRLAEKQEPFGGWLSFFKQHDLVEVV